VQEKILQREATKFVVAVACCFKCSN